MIGEKLRQLRGERSSLEMAEKIGITLEEYERIEATSCPVGIRTLLKISNALEVEATFLTEEERKSLTLCGGSSDESLKERCAKSVIKRKGKTP